MNKNQSVSPATRGVDEDARASAVARLHHLFITGGVSLECLSEGLGDVLAASSLSELENAMSALPPLVRLTPASHRLARPLVLRVPNTDMQLGVGWQLAADTTICTGAGTARLDLTIASWDAPEINLRVETWGSFEILVPEGVAVQITGGTASVQVDSLSPPLPGGPLLRVSSLGPGGLVRIRHRRDSDRGLFTRWRGLLARGGARPA